MRVAIATSGDDPGPVELARAADAVDAASGWAAVLEHGMRVALPDPRLVEAVDLARTQVLLDPDPGAATTAALEDWGHDDEAAWAWRGLSLARPAGRAPAPGIRRTRRRPAGVLESVHRMLLREAPDATGAVDLAPALPPEWWGQDLEVHDAPTRAGRVSYAIRWHGPRPALLWEVTDPAPGLRLRAPTLDPAWSSTEPAGETLLQRARHRPPLTLWRRDRMRPSDAKTGGWVVEGQVRRRVTILAGARVTSLSNPACGRPSRSTTQPVAGAPSSSTRATVSRADGL